jgi:YspA, cpYpsA-related SLOG family
MFKVIVAGSRSFNNYDLLKKTLDYLLQNKLPNVEIVSGGARGADKLGERYAAENNLKIKQFIPDWDAYGKSAGYRRNVEMAKYSDACVCFWDGMSRGTNHMIDIAKKEGIKLKIIYYKDNSI